MALPSRVHIQDVAPRDGLQMEARILTPIDRVRLIAAIAEAGVPEIEIGSFVSAAAVPQMADTDAVAEMLPSRRVAYRGLWLNTKGLERALLAPRLALSGYLQVAASDAFSRRNTRKSRAQTEAEHGAWIDAYDRAGIAADTLVVMTAFGCNYEGEIAAAAVSGLIDRCAELLRSRGLRLGRVVLADTMGWASPAQVRRLTGTIRDRLPDLRVRLHLHDTRGLALANALAALEEGVDEFDAAVGGMGGCPFSGSRGAVGNMCTEDFVFLCKQLGIETGIDIAKLIAAARLAEQLVGHELPGRLMKAGVPQRRTAVMKEPAL